MNFKDFLPFNLLTSTLHGNIFSFYLARLFRYSNSMSDGPSHHGYAYLNFDYLAYHSIFGCVVFIESSCDPNGHFYSLKYSRPSIGINLLIFADLAQFYPLIQLRSQ